MLNSKAAMLGFCLSCALGLSAQDCHIALRGHIVEAGTGEPLAYASVSVPEAEKGAISDEKGYFVVADLCENTPYTVEISHVECDHFTQVVRLKENTEMDFRLIHNAVLKEVVIREKAVAPAPAQPEQQVDEIDLAASRGINLGETLRRLPGVTTLNTGLTISKPVIQGLHSNRIAIVANGLTLEGQQWGSEHAPEIDPFSAGKISVVKGAAGVRYGTGALAGAVVLEPAPLRREDGMGGWVALGGYSNGLGLVASGALDWHLPGSTAAFRLQGTAKKSGNLRTPDYYLGNTGAAEFDLSAMAGWGKERWTHEAVLSTFNQRLGILRASHIGNLTDLQLAIDSPVPLNNDDAFTYGIERPYQQVGHMTAKYKVTQRLSDKWKWSGQYAFQFNHRREYDVVRSSGTAADKPQLSFRLWTNTIDLSAEHMPIGHWQGGAGVQGIQQTNFVGLGGLIPDYRTAGASLWAMERWRRFPNPWEFEFGARYDYRRTSATTSGSLSNIDTLVHFGSISATAGAIYHFGKYLSATLNSGYAWRPPHVNELFARGVHHGAGTYEQGRPDLSPEKALNTSLSISLQKERLDVMLTLYHNRIRDFIYLDPQNTFILTVRGAFPAYFYAQSDAVLQGLDGNASLPFAKNWSLEARISLLRGYRLLADSLETPANDGQDWLPLMPVDRIQYGLKWSPGSQTEGGTFVRLMAATALRQSRIPDEGLLKDAPPAFTTIGLDAGHTFRLGTSGRSLEIGLSVQNLGNIRYREYLNFFRFYADEPGLNVGLRAKMTFGG
ncbi:MAG: TonB-dependent receptor [Lewinellaceae bacterium]|nr:TonB-dependent receptor [Lewinellaceae bacterium]